ncbi:hypothetical protein ACFQH6_02500 [Halobacteriaceae archaeon GCM10025711]
MHWALEAAASLVVGVLAFAAATVAVTAVLDPHVGFSLLVGLPAGFTTGIAAVGGTYAALSFRDERATGEVSRRTAARFWAAVATVAGMAVVVLVATVAFLVEDHGAVIVLLAVGLPVAVVVSAVAGYVWGHRRRGEPVPLDASRLRVVLAGVLTFAAVALGVTAIAAPTFALYLAGLFGVTVGLGAGVVAAGVVRRYAA